MTPEELNTLCKSIQDEQDPKGFSILVDKLNELLAPPPKPLPENNEQSELAGK